MLAEVFSQRGLYADGANYLVGILEAQNFILFDPHRLTHNVLTQFPVVTAIWLGVSNLRSLSTVFTAGLVCWPMFFWGLALYHLRTDRMFWPFVMLFTLAYCNTGFFIVGEENLCFAQTVCILAFFMRQKPLNKTDCIIFTATALLYPLVYASTFFYGPVFFLWALLERKQTSNVRMKKYWLVMAALFFIAATTGLWEVLTPRDSANFTSIFNTYIILENDWRYWLTLIAMTLIVLMGWIKSSRIVASLFVLCLGCAGALFAGQDQWSPSYAYGLRLYMTITLLFFYVCSSSYAGLFNRMVILLPRLAP